MLCNECNVCYAMNVMYVCNESYVMVCNAMKAM